jgi:hypothetical protein
MVNEKGGKGGNRYGQRKGMKTRKKGGMSGTVKVKTIAKTRTKHDRPGSSQAGSVVSTVSELNRAVGLAHLARMTTATSPCVSYSSMQRSYDVKGHDK